MFDLQKKLKSDYSEFHDKSKHVMRQITNFYLEIKEDQDTMTEKLEQYDQEIIKLEESNSKMKKSIKLLKDDFSRMTQKQGRKDVTKVLVWCSTFPILRQQKTAVLAPVRAILAQIS